MPRDSNGQYTLYPLVNPVVPGTVIDTNWANPTLADVANALTQSISSTGLTPIEANLPMSGFHHTGVSDPTARNQYATLGMVQDGRHIRVTITGGVDNLIGNLVGGATTYVPGTILSFVAPALNTGPMTLNYNGIGAKSIVSATGLPLVGGDVHANDFLMALYDDTQFKLLTQVQSTTPSEALTANTTGQERPPGGVYPALTIATASTVNVPGGSAWIVPPSGGSAVEVTWATQTIALQFLTASFSTTIAVDDTGTISQFAGRALGATLRNFAVLGVVTHPNGAATTIVTRPQIFADDGYRGTDTASLLTNSIVSGALITGNTVALLQLDISAGSIFMPGGSANTPDSPNIYPVFQQNNIQFRTMAGTNTISGAVTATAPITQYDPNGSGVVTVLPGNNDTVIHRLYYLYGSFIWVYGQIIYSSVENALSFIEYDRTKYRPSMFLQDAVLVAEIACRKAAANLSLLTDCAIVAPGGINFSIGSPGGIAEAPIDGTPYGRQNAAWVQVLRSISPQVSTDMTITGPAPMINEVVNPVGAGTSGLRVKSGVNNWFGIEVTNPDDKAYFRSYNPATGALRFTTTYDLALGIWTLPGSLSFAGLGARIFGDFSNLVDSGRTLFQTKAVNDVTVVGALPSGTSQSATLIAYNRSDADNAGFAAMGLDNANVIIKAGKTGTGAFVPLRIATSGFARYTFDLDGSFIIESASAKIKADFTSTPLASRVNIQTSVVNGATGVGIIPNGTGNESSLNVFSAVNPDQSSYLQLRCLGTFADIIASRTGAATFPDLRMIAGNFERLRVSATTGFAGFGDTAPAYQLTVFGQGNTGLTIPDAGNKTAALLLKSNTDQSGTLLFSGGAKDTPAWGMNVRYNDFSGNGTGSLIFYGRLAVGDTQLTERLSLSREGRIYQQAIIGSGGAEGYQIFSTTAGDAGGYGLLINKKDATSASGANFYIGFLVNSGGNGGGSIRSFGPDAAGFFGFSDISLKENVVTLEPQLNNILALRPVEYDLKDGSGHSIGFIAQEVQEVYPDIVHKDEQNGLLGITGLSRTDARLVSAIQGLNSYIEKLEARIAALEARLGA